jgi:hypothetical protein
MAEHDTPQTTPTTTGAEGGLSDTAIRPYRMRSRKPIWTTSVSGWPAPAGWMRARGAPGGPTASIWITCASCWTTANPATDAALHASPILLSSPLFNRNRNYSQVAFETNLPRIEGADSSPNNACQRHVYNPSDPSTGAGCVDPPVGASFYPIYTTGTTSAGAGI